MAKAFLRTQIYEVKVFLSFAGLRENVDFDKHYKKIYFGFIWVKVISETGLLFFSKFFKVNVFLWRYWRTLWLSSTVH